MAWPSSIDTSENWRSSVHTSTSRCGLSMVSDTLTSEVATISTGVSKRSNTSKMRFRNPCAINMRVEWMLTSVILRLQAIDFTALEQGTASDTMRVPSTSGLREFRISTGIFFSTAGMTVAGCSTLAPKYASSAASAKEMILTRCPPGRMVGSAVSMPSTSVQI